MKDIIRDEQERRARLLIEQGGEPPTLKARKPKQQSKPSIGTSDKEKLWHAVFSDLSPSTEWNPSLPLPDGISPDSIYLKKIVARKKLKNPTVGDPVDVSLDGNGEHRHMTVDEAGRVYSAIAFANTTGLVFNAHTTISWGLLGYIDHDEASRALIKFTKCFREWGRKRKIEVAYVYAHECSRRLGMHTHLLVAIPPSFLPKFKKWVKMGIRGVSRVQPIPDTAIHVTSRSKCSITTQWRWFGYICKGLNPYSMVKHPSGHKIPADYLIPFRFEPPGEVRCKKLVGSSSNIGAAMQRKNWGKSSWDEGHFDIRVLYSGQEYEDWKTPKEYGQSMNTDAGYAPMCTFL